MSSSYLACNNTYSRIKTSTKIYDTFRTQTLKTNDIEVKTISFKNGTFYIKPNENNYVAKFIIDNSSGTSVINLDIETESSSIGDVFTLMIKQSNINEDNKIHFVLSEKFYYANCGEYNSDNQMNTERIVIKFIYDGDKFVCTNNNF